MPMPKKLLLIAMPAITFTRVVMAGSDSTTAAPAGNWFGDKANAFLFAWFIIIAMQCAALRVKDLQQRLLQLIELTLIVGVAYLSALTVSNTQNGPAVFGLLV